MSESIISYHFIRSSKESTTSSRTNASTSVKTRTTTQQSPPNNRHANIRRNQMQTNLNSLGQHDEQSKNNNVILDNSFEDGSRSKPEIVDSSSRDNENQSELVQNSNQTQIVTSDTNKLYQVKQVESPNQQQQQVDSVEVDPLEPGQTRLSQHQSRVEQITAEEEGLSQHSVTFSQKSAKSTDDNSSISGTSGSKFNPTTPHHIITRSQSFVSADVNSFDFSRPTSENSLAFHEPFTPYAASPKTLYSRKSVISLPAHHQFHQQPSTIEEKNELIYSQIKDELKVNKKPQFSHSSSSSSETSTITPPEPRRSIAHLSETLSDNLSPEFEAPLEPSESSGKATFIEQNDNNATNNEASQSNPPEQGNLTMTSAAPKTETQNNNLIVDSQEMVCLNFILIRIQN